MKNNILWHFAFNDLKTHHKDTLVSLITLICIGIVSILITSITPLIGNQRIIEYQKQHGTYTYYSGKSHTMDEMNHMELFINEKMTPLKDANIKYSYRQHIGTSLTDESIDYVGGDYSILAIAIKEGQMPTKSNEIAVQASVLEKLGYQNQLYETVEIPYYHDDTGYQVGEWKVVGILETTGNSSVVVGEPVLNQESYIYIDTQNQNIITNYQELGLIYTLDDSFISTESLDMLVVIVQFVLFIIGCIILSGITIASFENRKDDYALLRGIGATKRQLYFVVFLQSVMLLIGSLFTSWLISMIVITILGELIVTIVPIQLNYSYFRGIIIIMSLMLFISYFMPARGACRRTLTGSFEGMEFQYFYYRYKKLHHMRPFYLGWRQLVNHKKQMIVKIFFIFIASLMVMEIIGNILYVQNLQQNKKSFIQPQDYQDIHLIYTPLEEKAYIDIEDIEVYKPYAKDIRYFHILDYDSYFGYYTRIYCYDENVKKEFSIQEDLKPGQLFVSHGFDESNTEDTIIMDEKTYTVQSQLSDYNDDFIIMNQEDFQNFGDIEHYQLAKVSFENIQQKTKGFIAFAKNSQSMKYNWTDSLLNNQRNIDYTIEKSSQNIPYVEIAVILSTSLIYIYQLSYEILKQRQTIGTYQLLGLRKIEIWQVYAYKSMMIAFIGFLCAVYYHFADAIMNYGGNGGWHIFLDGNPLMKQLLPPLLMILILISLSLLPIYSMLRKDGLENINMKD